ncbi:toxin [Rhodopirellula sp. SM50]|nr:addiction module protein [Rhodopirellula sp. SM50]PAY18116.1 toxin [Rhodopirellula sp. SM50]
MTVERAISDISSLPLEEQLLVVQAIWDRMPQDAGTTLTDRQRAELDRRLASYRENPDSALTESQLREQIRDARS